MATLPHGTWPSPIPASALTARQARIDEVRVDGESTYWLESRPWEKGRTALVRHDSSGSTDVLPEPWNCRSRVHEYGGGSYAVRDGLVVFCEFTTTRVLRLDPGATEPVPLTPEGEVRYGGLVLAGEQVFVQKCSHICAANAVHGLHGCKTGLIPPDLNGHQHRTFTFGTPATLATAFAANQGIIHFDQVGKAIDAVPVCHGLADLPQHAMGCIPGNAQLLGSPQHRNATLV